MAREEATGLEGLTDTELDAIYAQRLERYARATVALAKWWGLKEPFVRLVLAAHRNEMPDDADDLKTLLLDKAKRCGVALSPPGLSAFFDTPDELFRLMDGDAP